MDKLTNNGRMPLQAAVRQDQSKAPELIPASGDRLNLETPHAALRREITPTALFYQRSHFASPVMEKSAWKLEIGGEVLKPFSINYAELQRMPQTEITALLECAGNGRKNFGNIPEGEIKWGDGAVSNAKWEGVPLSALLSKAGIKGDARTVLFQAADTGESGPEERKKFVRALPLEDSRSVDILIATRMNGEELPVAHGHPARLIVPGWYAMASVKWLTGITVSSEPITGHYNTSRYVYVMKNDGRTVSEPVTRIKVKSIITSHENGAAFTKGGPLTISGKAWSGHGGVSKVEVHFGSGWKKAELTETSRYSWSNWSISFTPYSDINLLRVMVRATDKEGNVQPTLPVENHFQYGYNAIQSIVLRGE